MTTTHNNRSEAEKNPNILLTVEQKRKCAELEASSAPHAKEIATQYRKGRIDSKTFEELGETLKDPNKMQRDPYKHFIRAVAKGKFPNRAKYATTVLASLQATGKEQKYARELVRELSDDSSGPLSERREKEVLKKLADLRQEETTGTLRATADIHGAVEKIAGTLKAKETKPEARWSVEKPPKELIEKLNELEFVKTKAVLDQVAEKQAQLDQALSMPKRDEALVKRLEAELAQLDLEFEKIRDELEKPKQEWQSYLTKMASRYQALEKFLNRSGIDINSANRIKMWLFDLAGGNAENKTNSLKLEGLVINNETGKISKKQVNIEIVGLHFEDDRTDLEAEAPGELFVEYIDEKGAKVKASHRVFVNMLIAFEGYEEIDSLDEMNQKIAEETHHTPIAKDQEYSTEIIVGLDQEGNPIREHHGFKIQEIDQKTKTITLDRNTLTIPRQWIANSVHPALYFDRSKKKFSYGEFAKMVKQHGYKREVGMNETSEIGAKKEVLFLDNNGHQRWGVLEADEKSGTYSLTPADVTAENTGDDYIKSLVMAGVPMRIAATAPARIALSGDQIAKLQKLSPSEVKSMIENGNLVFAPSEASGGGRWVLQKDPHSRAAITMANKEATTAPAEAPAPEEEAAMPMFPNQKKRAAAEPDDGAPPEGPLAPPKPKFYEEALPYDEIYKVGGMSYKQTNFIQNMWTKTRLLSAGDLFAMGKSMWEYYSRRFERRQKARYSEAGKNLPFFAPEMQRTAQAAETEQVNQFKEAFDQFGVYQIQDRLCNTHNRDELKACFITLSEKGQLRWDDINVWQNINRFVDTGVSIPIPSNGDPNTRQSATDERTGFDFLKAAIDSMWGEGQYNEWFARNKSTFQTNARNYYEEGKQLEGVDGGHARRLSVLLKQHKQGEFVDPHEYEGLILHSIEAGKSSMQAKIYFMMEGVAAENSQGRTIMPFDRMAHINSEMLIRFPILEYLCAKVPRPPDGKPYRFTIDDYKRWVRMFDDGDPMNPDKCKPDKAVDRFMWETVIPSDETQNRINKVLRNGENLDHDDMFAYLPPATEEVITDACKATTGAKKFLTIEGYANVFPGFSQYIASLAKTGNRGKLREAIKSYVRFEGIMTSKYEKGNDGYQRMKYATLNSATIVSDTPPQAFINQLNTAIKSVVEAYNDEELNEEFRWMNETTPNFRTSKADQEKQKRIDQAYDDFGEVFTKVIKSDNGEKMTSILSGSPLEGMPQFISDEERAQRKAAISDNMALE